MDKKEKKLTGYPHLDTPWMKWYDDKDITLSNPDTNITDYLKRLNKDRGHMIAQTYYGREFTYDQLFKSVDDASRAFTKIGAGKGSTIFNLLPNIPESGHIWLGAAQIGAIADFADPRPDSMDIKANAKKILEVLKYEGADYIVAMDKCYSFMLKPIENELKEMGFKNIIIVSPADSMNIIGMIDYLRDVIKYNQFRNARIVNESIKKIKFYEALLNKIKQMNRDKKELEEAIASSPIEIIKYSELVKDSQDVEYVEVRDSSLVSYIGHTSGTSGARPKPIPLTNKNLINSTEQALVGGYGVDEGERVLHELPFFSPLGSCNNYLLDIACGANLIDVPEFEINEFGYLIKKYKPSCFMGTPSWLASLPSCDYLQNEDLSFLRRAIYGGDSMTREDEEKLNKWLKERGADILVQKGHGMSEYCGGGTYSKGDWHRYESIGIPFPHTIYGIVDPTIEDRLVPVKDKDENGYIYGELVVSSDAVTPGILNGDVIVKHFEMDGKSYIRTRDLVRMDEDGIFYFEARKDRSFTRFDGYKVKPAEIEREIEKNPRVKYCNLVYYYDEAKRGLMPLAHIVLEDSIKIFNVDQYVEIVEDIVNSQIIGNPDMSSRQIPSKFRFRESMPLTKNGKTNFNALIDEGLDGTEINVDVEETNMSVGSIRVYSNEVVKQLKKA